MQIVDLAIGGGGGDDRRVRRIATNPAGRRRYVRLRQHLGRCSLRERTRERERESTRGVQATRLIALASRFVGGGRYLYAA